MPAIVAIADALEVVGILQAADPSVRLSLYTDIDRHEHIKPMTMPLLSAQLLSHLAGRPLTCGIICRSLASVSLVPNSPMTMGNVLQAAPGLQ